MGPIICVETFEFRGIEKKANANMNEWLAIYISNIDNRKILLSEQDIHKQSAQLCNPEGALHALNQANQKALR